MKQLKTVARDISKMIGEPVIVDDNNAEYDIVVWIGGKGKKSSTALCYCNGYYADYIDAIEQAYNELFAAKTILQRLQEHGKFTPATEA